jgi:putative transcriptional regulator
MPIVPSAVRAKTALSQRAFAERYGLNLRSLQNFERPGRRLDSATTALFKLIDRDPAGVAALLAPAPDAAGATS